MDNELLTEHYLNPYLVRQCGIPDAKPKWSVSHKDFVTMFVSWTIGNGLLYVKSPKGHKNYALSLESGDVVWQCDVLDNECEGVCVCGEFICIGTYVHNASDGKILYDLRELVGDSIEEFQIFVPFRDGIICRVTGDRNRIVYVDLKKGCVEEFSLDLYLVRVTDDQGYVIGWSGRKICCLDSNTNKILWSYDVQSTLDDVKFQNVSFVVCGDKVYLWEMASGLKCLNLKNGSVVWGLNIGQLLASLEGTQETLSPINLVCSESALVLSRDNQYNGYIQVLDSKSGKPYWYSEIKSPKAYIAGDMVIVIYGDDSECMEIRDLYTGESLWEMPRPLTAMMKLLSCENKIVVSNTMGTFRCYEWAQPYSTPFRG